MVFLSHARKVPGDIRMSVVCQSLTFNVPEHKLQMALLLEEEKPCQIILKSLHKCISYGRDKLNL